MSLIAKFCSRKKQWNQFAFMKLRIRPDTEQEDYIPTNTERSHLLGEVEFEEAMAAAAVDRFSAQSCFCVFSAII